MSSQKSPAQDKAAQRHKQHKQDWMKTFYVTSLPPLGHLYTMIVADTIARSKRQRGIETYFLTGTDEHGINIERAAQKNGRTPQQQADYVVDYFKQMTSAFGLDTAHGGYD